MTFAELCERVGLDLEPFQEQIAKVALSSPESLFLLPRGAGKTTLMAALALYELSTAREPAVYCAAASRDQALILFEAAKTMADRGDLGFEMTLREMRVPGGGHLRVLSADARKIHGLIPSLAVVDELHAHADESVYLALRTAAAKRPGSRLVTISTAGPSADTPLGRLRARALAQADVTTCGALTVAKGPRLSMLEWSVPEDADVSDMAIVKQANPQSWLTVDALQGQFEAVPEIAFRRYHANQWAGAEAGWLPPGAWQACVGEPAFEDGERVWVGVDLGGEWSDSAVVWVNEAGHVGAYVGSGEEAIMEVAGLVEELAERYTLVEVGFDPWRSGVLAQQLAERGISVSHFPMTDTRTIPASAALHKAIVNRELVLPDDPKLREHAGNAIAKQSRRGWRIDKPGRSQTSGNIDGVVALMVAYDIKENAPEPVQVLGWI